MLDVSDWILYRKLGSVLVSCCGEDSCLKYQVKESAISSVSDCFPMELKNLMGTVLR